MTTIQLALLCLRHARIKDLAKLPMDAALTLVSCINHAVQDFYAESPAITKRTTISTVLAAPLDLEVEVTDGSNTLANNYFTAAQRGSSVRIGNDPSLNEIIAPDAVLDPYLGASGSQPARIYSDGIPLSAENFLRVTSDPRLDNGHQLLPAPELRNRKWSGPRAVGQPNFYYIDPVGETQGAQELLILRVDPMPEKIYRLRMEVELAPWRMEIGMLNTATRLPMPSHTIERHFLPLVYARLLGNDFWQVGGDMASKIMQDKAEAISALRTRPTVVARPRSKCRTPRGW